jgi:hypothetical protein
MVYKSDLKFTNTESKQIVLQPYQFPFLQYSEHSTSINDWTTRPSSDP